MFLYMLFKHDKCHFQIFNEISSIKGHLFLRTFNDQIDFVKAECKSGLMNVLKWYIFCWFDFMQSFYLSIKSTPKSLKKSVLYKPAWNKTCTKLIDRFLINILNINIDVKFCEQLIIKGL